MQKIDVVPLSTAVVRTWRLRGLAQRSVHELGRRSGYLQRREDQYLQRDYGWVRLELPGILSGASVDQAWAPAVRLYGALDVPLPEGARWHQHPLTGHRFDGSRHWSSFSDADPEVGDIKDLWELGRFSWLLPRVLSTDREVRRQALQTIRDWVSANPPYQGPHWMCAQETSLRGIVLILAADALQDELPDEDRQRIATVLARSVDRVRLTLRYALSQRNNHAISEAGFLWGASVLLDHPDATRLRQRAETALNQAIADQFLPDGSYAQHSPTYQRLALHVLLWCLRVGSVTGQAPPPAVREAVERSLPFLQSLAAPGSDGRVPNLGGNDGALLFDLAPCAIGDFRPLLVHASAALGRPSPFPPGPWDQEALVFGYQPTHAPSERAREVASINTHSLSGGAAHVVMRAGPLRHRPAHADQLHLDVWLNGEPVAVDPGSYRYTAPPPWGNALAEERVHNVPYRPGAPQAVRAGRFFWKAWAEAEVVFRTAGERSAALARLELADGTTVHRLAVVSDERVLVVDEADAPVFVRWNLPVATRVEHAEGRGRILGEGWQGDVLGGASWSLPERREDDPESGWHAPTYGVLEPLQGLIVPSDEDHRVVTTFGPSGGPAVEALLHRARRLHLRAVTPGEAQALLEPR